MCAAAGLPDRRADEVLALVGLSDVGKRKVRGYSMGMRQRLGLAATLLGDPKVLILDEPANGLDPDGIRWLRNFFRHLAERRTHRAGLEPPAQRGPRGRRPRGDPRSRQADPGRLDRRAHRRQRHRRRPHARRPKRSPQALAAAGIGGKYEPPADGLAPALRVNTGDPAQVGHVAFTAGVELHELRLDRFDLEQLFFSLTEGAYQAPPPGQLPARTARTIVMINLVRAEFLKLRSTQVWFWMLLICVALTSLVVVGQFLGDIR